MNKKTLFNELLLLIGTMIWGCAFVFQEKGMDYVKPFTFNVERSFIGSLFLIVLYFIIALISKSNKKNTPESESNNVKKYKTKDLIIGSIVCGIFLSLATICQQMGVSMEGAGKSGFITALYIIFVPLIGLFFKRKPGILILIGIVFALIGLFLINYTDGKFSWGNGSWLLLGCAVAFGLQITAVDYYSPKCNSILLTAGQFIVCVITQFPFMLIIEHPTIKAMLDAWLPVLFCGIMSSGFGYLIQVYTQKNVPPTIASIIMSLESVFSIIFAAILLKARYSLPEILGCVLIFMAIIVAQIPLKAKKKKLVSNSEQVQTENNE